MEPASTVRGARQALRRARRATAVSGAARTGRGDHIVQTCLKGINSRPATAVTGLTAGAASLEQIEHSVEHGSVSYAE